MSGGVLLAVDRFIFRFFIIWYICGVFLVGFDLLPNWLEWANAVFLIGAGALGGFYFYRQYQLFGLLFSLFVIVSTITIEWLGVQYGLFFGHYFYNPDFGLYIAGIPFTIGTAWLMVVATTHALAKPITMRIRQPLLQLVSYSLLGAVAAVVMDLILDPVAANIKEYWVWDGDGFYYGIPMSNFIGWFFIALTLHIILWVGIAFKRSKNNLHEYWQPRMILLYVLMIVMFSIISIINGFFGAPMLTITLMAVLLLFYFSSRRKR